MPGDWQLRDLASHCGCQKSLCCTEAHMALGENSSIPGIKFPYWPEEFAGSSAGANHPIYSSSPQSPLCQPLAETNDGQTPPAHKLCKGNKCTQQTAPNVCLAWLQRRFVKCQESCTHKASISLIKRFCCRGAREGDPPSSRAALLQGQNFRDKLYERKKGGTGGKGMLFKFSMYMFVCRHTHCMCMFCTVTLNWIFPEDEGNGCLLVHGKNQTIYEQGELHKDSQKRGRDLLLGLDAEPEQLFALPMPETTLLFSHSGYCTYTFPSGPRSDVLIYIFGCIFFPGVPKQKVFPSSAGLLLTASGEQLWKPKPTTVDYPELLVNLKTWVRTVHSIPPFLQHFSTSRGHRKEVPWFKCFVVLRAPDCFATDVMQTLCTSLLLWVEIQYFVPITKR